MPRNTSKVSNTSTDAPRRAIKVENTGSWDRIRQFLSARETRFVCGIVLLAFSVIALLAYVSYLFTGPSDQSILSLSRPERIANR